MLYGAAGSGGSGGYGTLFSINANGTGFKSLKNYTFANGSGPNGNLLVTNNLVYGTTRYGGTGTNGTVFKMSRMAPVISC